MTNSLDIKIHNALFHIRKVLEQPNTLVAVAHSGGKDSQVILHLTKQINPFLPLIHNVKPMLGTSDEPLTEMHPATLEFLYTVVAKENTLTCLHASNMPEFIKESKISCQIDGSRASEYNRKGKSANFIVEGESASREKLRPFIEKGIFGLNICYPIYDWTDEDVFEYIRLNNIPLSKEY